MSALPETELCAYLVSLRESRFDSATRWRLAQALLDWYTSGWAARDLPAVTALRELAVTSMGTVGRAPIFGGGLTGPLAAGFANGAITHLREVDDAHRAGLLHPGVVVISTVLALASMHKLTQREVANAIVAGYESAIRIGEALGARHAASFHTTATAGSLGAATASALALGLSRDELHNAMGIAATQSAGLWQFADDGAHAAKSLHPGFAVRNGMMAAWAARAGFPGAKAFITGQRGLHAMLGGDGPLAALNEALGTRPLRLHTVTIKAWPTCAMLFTPLDAVQAMMDMHDLEPSEISSVHVDIFPHALKIAGVEWPTHPSETAFCLRYVLAVLLRKGGLGVRDMEAPELDSPELIELARRIQVTTNDEFQRVFPALRPSRVTVTLRDGRKISVLREFRRGDPEDPYNWPQLLARMRAFVPTMDDAQAHMLRSWCAKFADSAEDHQICEVNRTLFGPMDLSPTHGR